MDVMDGTLGIADTDETCGMVPFCDDVFVTEWGDEDADADNNLSFLPAFNAE